MTRTKDIKCMCGGKMTHALVVSKRKAGVSLCANCAAAIRLARENHKAPLVELMTARSKYEEDEYKHLR